MAETDLVEMEDEKAFEKVKKFLKDGCGCALGAKDGPYSGQFMETVVLFNLNNCLELSNDARFGGPRKHTSFHSP